MADAVVVKQENPFFLADRAGHVPLDGAHGFGLYHNDCRYLNGYELLIGGERPILLVGTAPSGHCAVFELTNPDLRGPGGNLIATLLGLRLEALERRLRIVRPLLPGFVHWLEMQGVRVGEARVDLRFLRDEGAEGSVAVETGRREGELEIVVDRSGEIDVAGSR